MPILKLDNYEVFAVALSYLIRDWLHAKVGKDPPVEAWAIDAVAKVNKLNGASKGCVKDMDEQTKAVYDKLIEIKVLGHLRCVESHRRWICGSFRFCVLIGVQFSDQMANLIWRHDLSKYSHKEVLGYAIMFGDGSVDFRQLQEADEKFEWENTLYNHYAHNPHHPEYFYPLQEDGKRIRDKSVLELDPDNGQDYLDESIVDMLASRGERYLSEDPVFSVKKWFDIPERFMGRYSANDKKYVLRKLDEWREMARKFLAVPANKEKVEGLFDEREVVYGCAEP